MNAIDLIFTDEREQKILHDAMERLDMSAESVIRHWCRMGQLVDHQTQQGFTLAWVKDGKVVDPFDIGPKMAPMPAPEDLNRWGDDGGASVPTVRSCNRHNDCGKAEEEVMARRGIARADISFSFHCHDDECEDCFGS